MGQMKFPPPAGGDGHGWEMCSPEEESIDLEKLQEAMQYLEDALDDPRTPDNEEDGIRYACVIRNGRMIWPNESTPSNQGSALDKTCQIYSVTKVFGTAVLGMLIDRGMADLDMPSNSIIDIDLTRDSLSGERLYPEYGEIAMRHLATFTDGFRDIRPAWPETGMYYPFKPEPPLFSPPGSMYAYNSSPQVLAYCLTRLIYDNFGKPPYSWIKEECHLGHFFEVFAARQIGMDQDDWRWSNEFPNPGEYLIDLSNPEWLNIRPISQSMFMSAAAMARWGHLFLNRGNWDGTDVISSSFVDEATTVQVSGEIEPLNRKAGYREAPGRYGYMWWVNGCGGWSPEGPADPPVLLWPDVPERSDASRGVYAANGYLANRCFVIHTLNTPTGEMKANMVVVRLARGVSPNGKKSTPGNFTHAEENQFLKKLGEAISD